MGNTSTTTGNAPGHAQPAASAGGVKPRLVWSAVRRHPIAVLLLVILAGGVAAGVWFFLPLPKMTGITMFRVASQPPAILAANSENKAEFTTYKTMQAALMRQRLVLNKALNDLKEVDAPALKKEPDQLAYLERNLSVDFKVGPEFMRVTIEGDHEEELKSILGAVSAAYLAEVDRIENGARKHRKDELTTLRKRYDNLLALANADLTKRAERLRFSTPLILAVLDEMALDHLRQLKRKIDENDVELVKANREYQAAKEWEDWAEDVEVPDADIDRAVDQLEEMRRRQKAVEEKRQVLEGRDKQLSDKKHPLLTAARKELADAVADVGAYRKEVRPQVAAALLKKMTEEQAALVTRAAARVEELKRTKEGLEGALKQLEGEISVKSSDALELERIREEIARNVKIRDQIVHELNQLEVETGAPLRVTEYERPYVAAGIEGNRRLKTALMAAAGTLLIGLVGLVFWESRNRRILAIDDVGKGLGLKVFGTVPPLGPIGDASAGREAALTEAVDTARTMLLYGTYGAAPKTVLVTSAMPGEGKTSLSGHLAISLARAGYRALLIDGDLRNPANHRIFDVPLGPGLCEVLRGEVDLTAAVRPTQFPGLAVLPAGRWSLGATQALAGDRWSAVRAAAEAEFDFVVIDSAPILPVADSLLLARHVDGVLLSVLHDHSRVASVAESQHRLMTIGANVLGVVVNGIEPKGGRYGYTAYGYPSREAGLVAATTA